MITDGVELPDGSFRVMWNQKLKLTTPATESDELIQQLGHLTECDTVRVVDSKLTDDGFRFLRTLPQLRQVQFIRVPGTNRSALDDTQLAKLAALIRLELQWLPSNPITDAGLKNTCPG